MWLDIRVEGGVGKPWEEGGGENHNPKVSQHFHTAV